MTGAGKPAIACMMLARIKTVAFQGTDVLDIDVQVQVAPGTMAINIVGLPDKAVKESQERVRAAMQAIGLGLPAKRITVNLSPADVLKEGSHFDLPIALGILAGMGVLPAEEMTNYIALGELALDGGITRVAGVLPSAIHAAANNNSLICPGETGGEAAWAGSDLTILAPQNLLSLINHFKGNQVLSQPQPKAPEQDNQKFLDMSDVRGQETARRVLEIAAAGGHNLLMIGPPGSGKSMLAARLPGILPPLSSREALEISMIHSLAGALPDGGLVMRRPFRDPHHSASLPAMVGGGLRAKPGEISLAHHGVLFLDELPEFQRQTLESLRQSIETGRAVVSRANHHVTYPSRFQLIAAMNPCRCGYLGDPGRACGKAPRCGADYQSKISGPIFDRIDLHVDVPAVMAEDLSKPGGENSASIARRVVAARDFAHHRTAHLPEQQRPLCNAQLDGDMLNEFAAPDADGQKLLTDAANKFKISARGYMRLLRVARTLADLQQDEQVRRPHIAEALAYRRLNLDQA